MAADASVSDSAETRALSDLVSHPSMKSIHAAVAKEGACVPFSLEASVTRCATSARKTLSSSACSVRRLAICDNNLECGNREALSLASASIAAMCSVAVATARVAVSNAWSCRWHSTAEQNLVYMSAFWVSCVFHVICARPSVK